MPASSSKYEHFNLILSELFFIFLIYPSTVVLQSSMRGSCYDMNHYFMYFAGQNLDIDPAVVTNHHELLLISCLYFAD